MVDGNAPCPKELLSWPPKTSNGFGWRDRRSTFQQVTPLLILSQSAHRRQSGRLQTPKRRRPASASAPAARQRMLARRRRRPRGQRLPTLQRSGVLHGPQYIAHGNQREEARAAVPPCLGQVYACLSCLSGRATCCVSGGAAEQIMTRRRQTVHKGRQAKSSSAFTRACAHWRRAGPSRSRQPARLPRRPPKRRLPRPGAALRRPL